MSELTKHDEYVRLDAMMTVREVAARAGVTDGRIRQLILEGRLVCVKRGGAWFIDPESAEHWITTRKTGRPPKQAATNAKG